MASEGKVPKKKVKWTVLTYIAAHNNLHLFGRDSLDAILRVGSTDDVVHGVLFDGQGGGGRYVMGEAGFAADQQQHPSSFDSGDPGALTEAAAWLFDLHPAERYGVVLWSHGNGWEPAEIEEVAREARPGAADSADESHERAADPGRRALFRTTLRAMLEPTKPSERAILFDDGTGHSLDTLELGRVARAIHERVEQPLDLLGMDACLMANLEVAYELRNDVRCLVASEELVPGHSWPYAEIYGALAARPTLDASTFGKLVVDEYVRYYTANPPGAGDVTKVALDLGRVGDLAKATSELAEAISSDIARNADVLWKVQNETSERETNHRADNKFAYHLWDLGTVAAGLAASAEASPDVTAAAAGVVAAHTPGTGAVLAEGHRGKWFDGIGGLSIYLMQPGRQRLSPSYRDLAFAKETQWQDMLEKYHQQLG